MEVSRSTAGLNYAPRINSSGCLPVGHTTTHCILVAQLYTQGKARGIFPFVVQLRDAESHTPLEGITIGEIGPKMGLTTVNQGFLGFNQVRIPRQHMLMKYAQVSEDGTFVKGAPNVLTYGTMTFIRVGLVRGSAAYLAMGATIATRYSAVRKQSQINPQDPEVQIMDHLTQQHKLFPQLAKCIVFKWAADHIWDMYKEVTAELERGQLSRLPEMHALSCCLKAVTITEATMGIETLRLACGGHGYMASSNMSTLYGFATAARTYEGENTVLLLQTSRYLMKAWKSVLEGKALRGTVAYLSKVSSSAESPLFQSTVQGIAEAFQLSTGRLIQQAYASIEARMRTGSSHEEATNGASIELVKVAEMHCRSFLIVSGCLNAEKSKRTMSPALGNVLQDLLELYAVDSALTHLDVLMPFVRISNDDVAALQSRLEAVLNRIRPNAVGIVDSFDFHDVVLNSTLGAYDGNVYERLFEDAMKSPLNQEPVNRSFELYLKPLMTKSKM